MKGCIDKMAKKVINVIEIIIQIIAMIIFFNIVGYNERQNVTKYLYEFLSDVSLYAIPIYTFWGLNFVMCLVSVISKSKKKDGVMHCVLPILIFLINIFALLALLSNWSANTKYFVLFMFIMIIVSFVKRANVFCDNTVE